MNDAYKAKMLPLKNGDIQLDYFVEELIDATSKLEVYKEKIKDSKLDSSWFMPTLQQKEAIASSMLEGTQATLDGVLINQITPNQNDKNLTEVFNYYRATEIGYRILSREDFSVDLFLVIHKTLMEGNVRKPSVVGKFRTSQNYVGKNDASHSITYIPPSPDSVNALIDNLIEYINNPQDSFRPLVRTAIIHAQFETIHPFMDGNGRVGRMLIPLYLYSQRQISLPCFFISEALERDKLKYYTLLNNTRKKNDWNEWIKFFLSVVARQCDKYIKIITEINELYDKHLNLMGSLLKTANAVDLINCLYKYPVTNAKQLSELTKIPLTSINRYLSILLSNNLLFTDDKSRNRKFFYYELLDILRA